jgi:hypothetical protein
MSYPLSSRRDWSRLTLCAALRRAAKKRAVAAIAAALYFANSNLIAATSRKAEIPSFLVFDRMRDCRAYPFRAAQNRPVQNADDFLERLICAALNPV